LRFNLTDSVIKVQNWQKNAVLTGDLYKKAQNPPYVRFADHFKKIAVCTHVDEIEPKYRNHACKMITQINKILRQVFAKNFTKCLSHSPV